MKKRKKIPYLWAILIFWFLIPHLLMSLPDFSQTDPELWDAAKGFWMPRLYLLCVWIGVPLSAGVIGMWQVVKEEMFSKPLVLVFALALFSYLPRIGAGDVLVLSGSLVILAGMGGFSQLKRWGGNWKYLASLCLCTVVVLGVIQTAGAYLARWDEYPLPILLFPLWLLILILPMGRLKKAQLSNQDYLVILVIFALSALLATTLHMHRHWLANLVFVMMAFAAFMIKDSILADKPENKR